MAGILIKNVDILQLMPVFITVFDFILTAHNIQISVPVIVSHGREIASIAQEFQLKWREFS